MPLSRAPKDSPRVRSLDVILSSNFSLGGNDGAIPNDIKSGEVVVRYDIYAASFRPVNLSL